METGRRDECKGKRKVPEKGSIHPRNPDKQRRNKVIQHSDGTDCIRDLTAPQTAGGARGKQQTRCSVMKGSCQEAGETGGGWVLPGHPGVVLGNQGHNHSFIHSFINISFGDK